MVVGRGSVRRQGPEDCCKGGFMKTQVCLGSEDPGHQRLSPLKNADHAEREPGSGVALTAATGQWQPEELDALKQRRHSE